MLRLFPHFSSCRHAAVRVAATLCTLVWLAWPRGVQAAPAPFVQGQFLPAGVARRPMRWEVASDAASRARGLMHRRHLAPGHGMLFVFEDEAARSFWMKDTFVPLDMVFADAQCRIVCIVEHTEPHSTASCSCRTPSQFVVEVPAGSARRLGAKAGGLLQFDLRKGDRGVLCPPSPAPDAAP